VQTAEHPLLARRQPRPSRRLRRGVFAEVNLLLALVLIVPFLLLPAIGIILYSFGSQNPLTGAIHFGWTTAAWRGLNDPIIIAAFLRSVALSSFATTACAMIGFPFAYFIARHAGRFRSAALVLVIAPFWVSFIVRTYAWLALLDNAGPINRTLLATGLVRSPLTMENNNVGVAIGIIYDYLPVMVFPVYVALQRIPESVVESAYDLGASRFSLFRRVLLPLSLPGLVAGCILVWIPALGEYVIPTILGGGKTLMIGNLISLRFTYALEWPLGSAMSLGLMAFAVAGVGVAVLLLGRDRTAGALAARQGV
jgi:spermidine/putrescine transport system permease protein